MTTLQEILTPEIEQFCADERIGPYVKRAFTLIEEHFPDAEGVRADLVWDPDVPGDTWVSLTVALSGSLPEIMERDDRFMDGWIAEIPWPAGDKIVVQLDIV